MNIDKNTRTDQNKRQTNISKEMTMNMKQENKSKKTNYSFSQFNVQYLSVKQFTLFPASKRQYNSIFPEDFMRFCKIMSGSQTLCSSRSLQDYLPQTCFSSLERRVQILSVVTDNMQQLRQEMIKVHRRKEEDRKHRLFHIMMNPLLHQTFSDKLALSCFKLVNVSNV